MTDRDALLAAVLANPDDDHPRLVMADWFEGQGDVERAEFIRVQCEYTNPPAQRLLKKRQNALLNENARKWCPLVPKSGWRLTSYNRYKEKRFGVGVTINARHVAVFTGGFVHELECTAAAWLAHGDAITAAHPVRTVRLTTRLTSDELLRTFNEREPPPPIPDDGETTVRTDNAELRTLFAVWWPGIRFELPADPVRGGMTVNGRRVPIREWSID